MSGPFGYDGSVKALELIAQYKRMLARKEALTPVEREQLRSLETKIAGILNPKENKENLNRRQALRVNTNLAIHLKTVGDFKKAFIKNISGGGLYVSTTELRPVGTEVTLEVVFPNEVEPIKLLCEVTWLNPKQIGNLEPGLGLKFKNLAYDIQKKIDKLIQLSLDHELKKKPK